MITLVKTMTSLIMMTSAMKATLLRVMASKLINDFNNNASIA